MKNENIVYFSSDEWGGSLVTSQYHIAIRLAKENKVLYINSIGLRTPTLSKSDASRILYKFKMWTKGLTKINDNLFVFSPIVIPFYNSIIFQKINKIILIISIKYFIIKLKMKFPILLTFMPNVVDILGYFKEKLTIYYCADQMASFRGAPATIVDMEMRLIKKVDIIFATSQCLYEEKKQLNKNTYYLPHGVDWNIFRKALLKETEIPKEMLSLKKPIIGFFGLVCSEWLDFELLKYIADKHKEWSIVLIGKVADDVPDMRNWKNIVFLGPKKYVNLPEYCKAFDVAIIPFKMTELVRNVNPLKLKEYLAAGNPVVSTRLPEIEKYKDIVSIADTYGGFDKAIEKIVSEDNLEARNRRSDSMKNESWEAKYEEIAKIVDNFMIERK